MNALHLSSAGKPPRSRCRASERHHYELIIIPSKDVIRADGTLCGYGGVLRRGKSSGDRTNLWIAATTQVLL